MKGKFIMIMIMIMIILIMNIIMIMIIMIMVMMLMMKIVLQDMSAWTLELALMLVMKKTLGPSVNVRFVFFGIWSI